MKKIHLAKMIEDIGVPITDHKELEELNIVQSQNGYLCKKANTSFKFYLLAIKNDIVYEKFTRAINPLILDKWYWSAVMPQWNIRSANSSNLLSMLVPLISNIYYLLLLSINIVIPKKTEKEKDG